MSVLIRLAHESHPREVWVVLWLWCQDDWRARHDNLNADDTLGTVGKNSTLLSVPFLNLIANLQERAGGVFVRLGGNTQEFAMMVEEGDPRLQQYHTFGKQVSGSTQTVCFVLSFQLLTRP